ncbi:MAG: alpha-amylase family glycosyl hydrolase, partial [Saccharofermentanales bacterium]
GAIKALDHCQELGVNGIWINPVYQKSEANRAGSNNGYSVFRYDQIDSVMTGTTDKEKSFAVAKKFVDEAHKRNIRVFFDIVVWGADKESPHVTEHPEWFTVNDELKEGWGGYLFTWSNASWREWYTNNAVQIALKTGIDGFRCDLEPHITGYNLWGEVRRRLLEEHDRKIAIISEGTSSRMGGIYDFEQVGVGEEPDADMKWDAENYFMENNIVDSIQTGRGIGIKDFQITGHGGEARFYTMNLVTHDSKTPRVRGNKVRIGYQAIFTPFIPFWFIGEEWNNPRKLVANGTGVMYFNEIQWSKLDEPANKAFYESVKKMIRIRRTYPEIFQYYPDNHKETNICKVSVEGISLQAYARYADGKGILVVPNVDETKTVKITIPYQEMGMLGADGYKITDLNTDKVIKTGKAADLTDISVAIESQDQKVLLVEATSALPTQPAPTTPPVSSSGAVSASASLQSGSNDSQAVSVLESTGSQLTSAESSANSESGKPALFTDLQLIIIALAALVLIGSGFAIFYILFKRGLILNKK